MDLKAYRTVHDRKHGAMQVLAVARTAHALQVGGNGSRENPSRKKFLMLEILFWSSRHARTN